MKNINQTAEAQIKPKRQKPVWLKKNLPTGSDYEKVRQLVSRSKLHTVCQEAKCPNMWECFSRHTATFMIMGDLCTRNCRFCNVKTGTPLPLDPEEPLRVAKAALELGLKYVVITSVTRDDLEDGGAAHFAQTIMEIRKQLAENKRAKEEQKQIEEPEQKIKIEVLIPDFQGGLDALNVVMAAEPDVLNHNIETVPSLYPTVRPEAQYKRSLELIQRASSINLNLKQFIQENQSTLKITNSAETSNKLRQIPVKSGIMVGLGEQKDELERTIVDLYKHGCRILTIGQYLQPSAKHLKVVKYYTPEEFEELKTFAKEAGFQSVASAPFVRSSYQADSLSQLLC
ncbi:MAG: lipoyl synthase [Desulfamplus sp.]|nr:lipoyl synthase [Desulfamplus sp.]